MRDTQPIQKLADHFPLRSEQPDLEYLCGDVVSRFATERIAKPEMPFVARFSFHENRSQFSTRCDILDHHFVNGFFVVLQVTKNLIRQFRCELAENLVALH
jgi:hypothetical protein